MVEMETSEASSKLSSGPIGINNNFLSYVDEGFTMAPSFTE
jgi:hypothetical protein